LGKVIGTVMVFHDVSEARKLQHQLSYQASHDALTGLYNRREFENNLEYSLLESRRDSSHHCLCYLDLDQFKLVNDTCGHVAGDELLIQLSTLLKEHVRDSDMLARLGGDEFGILFNYCSMKDARRAAEKLLTSINNFRFVWQEHSFDVGASIGVVAINRGSRSIADILSAADVACYAAKDGGRNRVHIYEPDDEELKQRHGEMRWVSRIKTALTSNQFILYYQPIEPINGQTPGHKRFEILVRMLGPEEQIIPPMAFIPAAERYGLMPEIDRWVIRNTLDALTRQPKNGEKWICSINLSGQSLSEEGFLEFILKELEDTDIDPGCICFEITETAAIANLNNAVKFISALKETGCSFSLDDFGSGLSSFAYLKNLKVDFLKIDGGFVKNMVTDPINNAMVEAINDIGHVMNIQTVAEFAENEAIIGALKDLGVDFAQGYGIDIPRPLEELTNITPNKKNLAS
jgi:diguanylate cyclase (GGDEF)-like protein